MQPLSRYKLFICCNTPEAISSYVACLILDELSRFMAYLMDFKMSSYKMHMEMKQGVWWVQSLRKHGLLYFCKA